MSVLIFAVMLFVAVLVFTQSKGKSNWNSVNTQCNSVTEKVLGYYLALQYIEVLTVSSLGIAVLVFMILTFKIQIKMQILGRLALIYYSYLVFDLLSFGQLFFIFMPNCKF